MFEGGFYTIAEMDSREPGSALPEATQDAPKGYGFRI